MFFKTILYFVPCREESQIPSGHWQTTAFARVSSNLTFSNSFFSYWLARGCQRLSFPSSPRNIGDGVRHKSYDHSDRNKFNYGSSPSAIRHWLQEMADKQHSLWPHSFDTPSLFRPGNSPTSTQMNRYLTSSFQRKPSDQFSLGRFKLLRDTKTEAK